MNNNNSLEYWLKLARTDGIGPINFFGLLAKFGDAKTALSEVPKLKTKNGNLKFKIPTDDEILQEIKTTNEFGGQILRAEDKLYPNLLANIPSPPPVISIIGDVDLLSKPSVAIIGSRNASAVGLKIAGEIARNLGNQGYIIVSGLARGIDTIAHKSSINTGTIAVLAGGIDYIYPPENIEIYNQIKEKGLIVSENRLGHEVFARDFPRRNRIISGLSKGVIVTEALEKSGTLITARYALEQGREVMAVPGSPLDPRAKGTNDLIKQGASLITSAQDVIECLNNIFTIKSPDDIEYDKPKASYFYDTNLAKEILNLLSPTPVTIEELCQITQLPWRTIAVILVELELENKAKLIEGNKAIISI